jgi:hypothetical protein
MGDVNEYSRGWCDGLRAGSQSSAPLGSQHPKPTDYDLGHRHGHATAQKFAKDLEPPRTVEITENDLLNVVSLAIEIQDKSPAEQASIDQLIARLGVLRGQSLCGRRRTDGWQARRSALTLEREATVSMGLLNQFWPKLAAHRVNAVGAVDSRICRVAPVVQHRKEPATTACERSPWIFSIDPSLSA